MKNDILNLKSEIFYLERKKSQAIASDEELDLLKNRYSQLSEKEKDLKIKQDTQIHEQRKRKAERIAIQELKATNPVAYAVCFSGKKSQAGRPRIEEEQPELLKAITDIATYGSGTDDRRRTEMIRSIHTLDDLTDELRLRGFNVRIQFKN